MKQKLINDSLTSIIQDLIMRNADLSCKNGYMRGKLETIKDICKREKSVSAERLIKIIDTNLTDLYNSSSVNISNML